MSTEKRDGQLSIEESFEQLEEILEKMEKDETGLEDSFRLYEQGMKLLKNAEESIDSLEQQVRILNRRDSSEQ